MQTTLPVWLSALQSLPHLAVSHCSRSPNCLQPTFRTCGSLHYIRVAVNNAICPLSGRYLISLLRRFTCFGMTSLPHGTTCYRIALTKRMQISRVSLIHTIVETAVRLPTSVVHVILCLQVVQWASDVGMHRPALHAGYDAFRLVSGALGCDDKFCGIASVWPPRHYRLVATTERVSEERQKVDRENSHVASETISFCCYRHEYLLFLLCSGDAVHMIAGVLDFQSPHSAPLRHDPTSFWWLLDKLCSESSLQFTASDTCPRFRRLARMLSAQSTNRHLRVQAMMKQHTFAGCVVGDADDEAVDDLYTLILSLLGTPPVESGSLLLLHSILSDTSRSTLSQALVPKLLPDLPAHFEDYIFEVACQLYTSLVLNKDFSSI
jgi:hypothetical protein